MAANQENESESNCNNEIKMLCSLDADLLARFELIFGPRCVLSFCRCAIIWAIWERNAAVADWLTKCYKTLYNRIKADDPQD